MDFDDVYRFYAVKRALSALFFTNFDTTDTLYIIIIQNGATNKIK